ncbi:MAG TPA: hypothetical protein PKX15_07770 [Bacteroidales bacterium]|jgi:hypothetical protein|nr:hypothetical protein [Bacteroidales bacterium]HOS16888.1 hypothetical protein [Bacteroidales bacterium]
MKHISILLYTSLLFITTACSPKITTTIVKNYPPIDYQEEVRILGLYDSIPADSEELGIVKIGDSGFTVDCGWDVVIDYAKMEARKAGGNAIQIIEHTPPNPFGSSCHKIIAKIYRVNNFDSIPNTMVKDSSLLNADYALLNVYRQSAMGVLVSYELYLGDTFLCRVSNKTKKSIRIRKEGSYVLWAKTETKEELPINLKFGNNYYIRCGVSMGVFMGRPELNLIDNSIGKTEFQSIKLKKIDLEDLIVTINGQMIDCIIDSEDDEYVYFTVLKDNQDVSSQMKKSEIKRIDRSE